MIAQYFDKADQGKDFTITTRKGNIVSFVFEDGQYIYQVNGAGKKEQVSINMTKEIIMTLYQDQA